MNSRDASLVVSPTFFLVGLPKTYITCVKSDNLRAKIITCKYQNMKQKIIVKISNNTFYFPLKSSFLSCHVLFLSQECYHYHIFSDLLCKNYTVVFFVMIKCISFISLHR
jgi:hypothetical protein